MKHILVLSALSGMLALSGCSTLNNMVGNDDSGMHDVQATNKNTAPVASKNGMLVDASNHMTLYYTYGLDKCGLMLSLVVVNRYKNSMGYAHITNYRL